MVSDAAREALLEAARAAAQGAYAPYSGICVGAAVLLADGSVVAGANIENAAQNLNCCAERAAIYAALARSGVQRIQALAVSMLREGEGAAHGPISPCGPCRQVMAEFMDGDAPVLVDGGASRTVGELLPDPYRPGGSPR